VSGLGGKRGNGKGNRRGFRVDFVLGNPGAEITEKKVETDHEKGRPWFQKKKNGWYLRKGQKPKKAGGKSPRPVGTGRGHFGKEKKKKKKKKKTRETTSYRGYKNQKIARKKISERVSGAERIPTDGGVLREKAVLQ